MKYVSVQRKSFRNRSPAISKGRVSFFESEEIERSYPQSFILSAIGIDIFWLMIRIIWTDLTLVPVERRESRKLQKAL